VSPRARAPPAFSADGREADVVAMELPTEGGSPAPARAGRRWRRLALVALGAALAATAAIVDWPRSDPAARRTLTLRAAELEAWLREELVVPIDRPLVAQPGGPADAAPAWRAIAAALEESAARTLAGGPSLPSLAAGGELRRRLDDARGARRFTPYDSLDALLDDEWPRAARLLATLVERAPAPDDGSLADWLDAAALLAADLRSTALLEPALHAARLEEAVARRLARGGEPLDGEALAELQRHALAALATVPPAALLAERESRLLQATVCMHADIPPFQRARARLDDGEPWPLVPAAAAVEQLESYDELLAATLREPQAERARLALARWVERVAAASPRVAPLLADGAALAPVRATTQRLERIVDAAARAAPGVDRARERQ